MGDLVQITKVTLDDDKIVLEINGGMKGKRKWYENVEVGMGSRTTPIGQSNTNAPGGTYLSVEFGKPVPPLQAADLKKMLAPILDFEKHSATEQTMESLPPEVQQAVKEKRAIEGMDRDQVILALGKPRTKMRETKEGLELEDLGLRKSAGEDSICHFQRQQGVEGEKSLRGPRRSGSTAIARTLSPLHNANRAAGPGTEHDLLCGVPGRHGGAQRRLATVGCRANISPSPCFLAGSYSENLRRLPCAGCPTLCAHESNRAEAAELYSGLAYHNS